MECGECGYQCRGVVMDVVMECGCKEDNSEGENGTELSQRG